METPNDDAQSNKTPQDGVDKQIQELLDEKELKIKWRKEIEQNEAIQNYFKSYHESSISSFIDNYLHKKYLWFRYGDMYKQMIDENQSQWIEMAHDHLEIILQKKLFDLQCLWRAEQIELEGIVICFDFVIWQNDIFNCPFLEPITKSDIALYQHYLLEQDLELYGYSRGEDWQDYDEIKAAYTDSDNAYIEMPEWYEFHNVRTGNATLLLLPDIRGEKEEFYSKLYFKNEALQKEKQDQTVSVPKADKRPLLSGYDKQIVSFFVKTFESKEIQNKHNHYNEVNSMEDSMYYDDIFRELVAAKEYIPIKANYDFREAIVQAYNAYRCKKLAEHLPLAFEQYQFNIKMGLSLGGNDSFYKDLRVNYVNRFIAGRVLNGEEPNLDF